ncbi:Serine/threonine-protein phosphatase 2A activator 1 [Myotisia sp. PD_48]|nr:Serine/threonine-protein phosphatase 2A activator 1 [Myotisia sp. PD_48]
MAALPVLPHLDPTIPHTFIQPSKQINDHSDINPFLTSLAYKDIVTFILQLNRCMLPSKIVRDDEESAKTDQFQAWKLDSDSIEFSEPVRRLQLLLSKLESLIDEVKPDAGPRRFGNISFRKWCEEMEARVSILLDECLPEDILQQGSQAPNAVTAKEELMPYLTGGFGSSQRLDYGTGHELSFLAFLAGLWKLNAFAKADPGVEERGIVIGIIEPYLKLVRRLILTYTLEPAGSHGVWGLDDHSFISYILGSAQLCPPIAPSDPTPVEGSLPGSPSPGDVTKANIVQKERNSNMYFSAIGFINDVKKGPFWEHSPVLYDISGIQAGWGKINKGMLKMYNAEVLSKFPVVQHFPFGSLFSREQDPAAVPIVPSAHVSSGPQTSRQIPQTQPPPPFTAPSGAYPEPSTRAPWAKQGGTSAGVAPGGPPSASVSSSVPVTRAPWAKPTSQQYHVPDR